MSVEVTGSYREVKDPNGRIYRIGESARSILGHGRWIMVLLPWIGMFLISTFEYGWGSAEHTLAQVYHWNLIAAFWNYTVYVVFEAGASYPTGWLRERGYLKPRWAVFIGGILVIIAYYALAHAQALITAYVGYAAIGGFGSGMVYSSCINMTSKWYPEKKGLRTGFVNGGYAYGSVPFIFLFSYYFHPSDFRAILYFVGLTLGLGLIVISFFFKDPPKNWWPEGVDPIQFALDKKKNRALVHNPPALKQWTTKEIMRTWQVYVLWITFVMIAGVSLFGTGFNVPFAKHDNFGPFVIAASMGVIAIINGFGRAFVGWVSDLIGRKQAMTLFFAMEGLTQFGVLWAGLGHNEFFYIFFAFFAGLGGGALFPLFATITTDYYGESYNASNYGVVYSAKIIGGIYGGVASAAMISSFGYVGGYLLAGSMGIVAAVLTLFYKQPVPAELKGLRKTPTNTMDLPRSG